MKTIDLSKLSDSDLDLTLPQYKAKLKIEEEKNSFEINENQNLLICFGNTLFLGCIKKLASEKYSFTGYKIYLSFIQLMNNEILYGTLDKNNSMILDDDTFSLLSKHAKSAYKRCNDFVENKILPLYHSLTKKVKLHYTTKLNEQLSHIISKDEEYSLSPKLTLREIYERKKINYEKLTNQLYDFVQENNRYDNKAIIYKNQYRYLLYIPEEEYDIHTLAVKFYFNEKSFDIQSTSLIECTDYGKIVDDIDLSKKIKWDIKALKTVLEELHKFCLSKFNTLKMNIV